MAVNYEIKSQLAKLLATEDLVVEHKNIDTAQFNVHTRVLTLPMWDKATNVVYDMLVGHEVGHALYTPDEDPPSDVPHQFINVTEDARIEKLMKRKYLGLSKTFFRAYQELNDQDFFEVNDEDINNMNLADKANLFFKIGNFQDISFNLAERQIIDMISAAETFDDAVDAARHLYEFCKEEQKKELEVFSAPPKSEQDQEGGEEESPDQGEGTIEAEKQEPQEEDSVGGPTEIQDPKVTTDELLESKLKDLVSEASGSNHYVELPKLNLETVIAPNEQIHELIDQAYARFEEISTHSNTSDEEFKKFKRDAQKEVNYLVKEFECRKAADSYARASTARTGVLDCTKLHTYKYNEDLFKKVTTLADGKNHGLVFILDWSGSMQYVLQDTIKQLFNLIWFCKKVNIPFEVYAFTNEWNGYRWDEDGRLHDKIPHYEEKEGLLAVDADFTMMNILSSKVKDLDKQLLNIWHLVESFRTCYPYAMACPRRLQLSGTPLNEALISLHQILPMFQQENKVQKVQCIVLTDGEANHVPYHVIVKRPWEEEPYLGCNHLHPNTFIRDRKTGNTYRVPYRWHEFTSALITNLKDRFPNTNFIGIRVLESRDSGAFMRLYIDQYSDEYSQTQKEWKKQRSFTIKNSGYDAYFAMSATALADDAEFEVNEGATKAQIKNAFTKSLKTKKLNKKVLGEFISLVA
ncbi:peptidase [Synechococcus phage SynMITS9220M01]|nr:peptidase [Synechococcus phage SynMITS9220M01]